MLGPEEWPLPRMSWLKLRTASCQPIVLRFTEKTSRDVVCNVQFICLVLGNYAVGGVWARMVEDLYMSHTQRKVKKAKPKALLNLKSVF